MQNLQIILEKRKKFILYFVFILAIFLITFHFTDTPKVWVDEGIFTNAAEALANHGVFGMQTDPGVFFRLGPQLSTNYPVIFPVAISLKLFGNGIWQSRLPMVIFMFLLTIIIYLYTKKRYGFWPAILSVFLLISFSPFYGNGRPVQGEVPMLFFLILGCYILLLWEEKSFQDKRLAIFSGLALGLSASTKSVCLLVLIVALPAVLFLWKKKIQNKKILLFFLISFFAPIVFWFILNFPSIELMMKVIPTFIRQAGNNGSSSLPGTSLGLFQTILINFFRFFRESTPILFLFLFVSSIGSFAVRFLKKQSLYITLSECLIVTFIILNWFGYMLGTGWYRYFFPANILLYLLFPASLFYLRSIIKNSLFRKIILIIPVILMLFQFFHLVFLSDTSFIVERTTNVELSEILSKVSLGQKVLFYNTPQAVVLLPGTNYSQYLHMEGLFDAGDKNSIYDRSNDFILINRSPDSEKLFLPCYDKMAVDSYFWFQKISNCKKI
jgi:hypothetical protein